MHCFAEPVIGRAFARPGGAQGRNTIIKNKNPREKPPYVRRAGEEKGIRCNVIAPGFMDTPMGRDASRRRTDRAVTVPFGRQGTGWEVAYAALFLISNESSYVNAHTLFLDAGHMAGIVRS